MAMWFCFVNSFKSLTTIEPLQERFWHTSLLFSFGVCELYVKITITYQLGLAPLSFNAFHGVTINFFKSSKNIFSN